MSTVMRPPGLEPMMTINGSPTSSPTRFPVLDPATGSTIGHAPVCTVEQVDAVMAAAQTAFNGWRADEARRQETLIEAGTALRAAADDLATALTAEQGKPLVQAREEVIAASAWFKYYGRLERADEVIQDDARALVEVLRRPFGVVAAITPWNYPVLLAAWKIAPALRAGNTIVVKPSPHTPLSTLHLGALLAEVFPPGVLNVVSGPDPLGDEITSHPVPRKISFTGSVSTGHAVARTAADKLARVTLELGGNDAAILLDDVNVEAVVERVFWGAFTNAGQVCAAIKRLYVPYSRHDELVEALVARAAATNVGEGSAAGVEMGPLTNAAQRDRIAELVADAPAGAIAVGGEPIDRPGYFYAPTVIAKASSGMRIVDEEQFGPALPVIPYRQESEAVREANRGDFGLGGSVWSSDPERADRLARLLECGTAWVNGHTVLAPHQPFGGLRESGLGVENGSRGLDQFSDIQVLHRPR